ncbi:glucokinase [Glaciecola sp. KUL10]|uniref:glucokinase n=1 Tax=Glaciecola sp. (strain KUL10) TaxID=2161813 RepID=UPI000D786471|nr:glucokinase [Glaciecola sp. KUL10]GBL03334.1 glucokinase [Glaciecola sp. KUL10]
MSQRFIADVGGTNIRLALVENGRISLIKKYLCTEFDTIADAILFFQNECTDTGFTEGCIGIACPVNNDLVKMTNHTWEFSKSALQTQLGLDALHVINDFTAVAHSLPTLNHNQVIAVGQGKAKDKGNIAVFGPGTGLGVEHLTWTSKGWQTLDGEGGHVDFAPTDENGLIVWQYLQNKFGRASAEEVLSGRGIVNIYNALAEAKGMEKQFSDPADISENAINNSDQLCVETAQQFCRVMGSFAGNLALNLCTTGGVFIGGGIVSKLGKFFVNSDFRAYFEAKGDFKEYVKDIPTYVIDEPDHGLLGALAFLLQQSKRTIEDE